MHPFVGDDPPVLGVFVLDYRLVKRAQGLRELLHKAQSRRHLYIGESIHQDVQAFSVGHGLIPRSVCLNWQITEPPGAPASSAH